jgi:hypothetical protein
MLAGNRCVTSLPVSSGILARLMQAASRQSFHPVEAGAILAGTVSAFGAGGALAGWATGNTGYGILGGVCLGIPAGVFVVYRRFKGYFS